MRFFFLSLLVFAASIKLNGQSVTSAPFKLVNSPYNEKAPVISPDGRALYFTIANHPQNSAGKKDEGDIWVSLWQGGGWSLPVRADAQLNNDGYNAVLGFSQDGSRIYLSGHYSKTGAATTQGISVSTKSDFGWLFPENISIPYFLNRAKELNGTINLNETIFIYSAEGFDTKGVEDIYVSLKKDGRWSEPINLGATINTNFQEWTPSIDEEGKTIYFSSNGQGGLGGFDVFSASRLDDSWRLWTAPKNMEQPINSDARELFFRPFQKWKTSLFTSTRNSDAYGNIFSWGDSLKLPEPDRDTIQTLKTVAIQSDHAGRILVSGRVTNSKTNSGISAGIFFKSDSTYSITSDKDGYFKLYIPPQKNYRVEASAKSYVNFSERLDVRLFELKSLEMNIKLQPIEVGAVVNLKSVLFYMGTTAMLEESFSELDVVVDFLKANPKVEIQLEGHTDNRGDAKKNLLLSQQRVEKIKSYLVSKGIQSKRIKGKGFGGSKPIATSDTEDSRKMNRRVEFVILKD